MEEGEKRRGGQTRILSHNLQGRLGRGGTGFICFLIHRIMENQGNFGKLSLETVGFGMEVSAKTWELQRNRR